MDASSPARLRVIRAGIDTYQQPVVYMHRDCEVCRSEGFAAVTRVQMDIGGRTLIATLNVVVGDLVTVDEVALSEAAWQVLAPAPGALASFRHPEPAASAGALRAKVFDARLDDAQFLALMEDTVASRLSDLELAAFVTACAGERLDPDESTSLTRAMVAVGQRLDWGGGLVLDKHCVGGLPGNRTTPIVVAIIAALGYRIPKTSSRAITSPAGTADTMEVMAPVALDLPAMRRVVEQEGGCIVWGGNVRLSPADDILIRVERPLDFDSDGQLVASVLSKKVAAGSTHVLIDMPIGPTAKVRSDAAAARLTARLVSTASALGVSLGVHRSDGTQPVGVGIGPALEAHDVLRVLRNAPDAPADLRDRAIALAGALLDLVPGSITGSGEARARATLQSGQALAKFLAICEAQGGFREPPRAPYTADVAAGADGRIAAIDNRRLARIAKLAGAPVSAAAGLETAWRVGDLVARGQPLFTVHAQSRGELAYALEYAASTTPFDIVRETV
ncbi:MULTISPECIES: thymidine phosphorylase family protein [Rhodanobacter]|uniref:thymidine phosphorylase family protein n=1 Tax=Rhodanobacter TaxID=75309 RepID=UPI0011FEA800|nr:thymidine phosphorylase family protein [Rhodanobacter thiooxydans]TAN15926.1 MAG: thymidine phosphorylase family protein [Rhodanobacter sp.]UJJ53528.1 thymidine phosphorylase family protein [Rhodanobacter thiooxydans]